MEKITPEFVGFKILDKSTEDIEKGSLITYKLKVHGIPLKWRTLINEFEAPSHFVDTQLKGPYKEWIHLHEFHETGEGCLMRDLVKYKVPMGLIGKITGGWLVSKDVKKIFQYRTEVINKLF